MLVEIKADFGVQRRSRAITYKNRISTTHVQVYKTHFISLHLCDKVAFFRLLWSQQYIGGLFGSITIASDSSYDTHVVCNILSAWCEFFFFDDRISFRRTDIGCVVCFLRFLT